jgi:hypothetical protein
MVILHPERTANAALVARIRRRWNISPPTEPAALYEESAAFQAPLLILRPQGNKRVHIVPHVY